ncbi:MAG TPA: hypothetical protein VNA25_14165 [Phycisphaerae bacterium]|nr:hypothetical protein [Phycisphaerae bacterium]
MSLTIVDMHSIGTFGWWGTPVDMDMIGALGWFYPRAPSYSGTGVDPCFLELLNEYCTIQVKSETAFDDYNQPINAGWGDELLLVPCRFETFSSVEVIDNQKVVVEDVNLMIPPGVTLTEERRVMRDKDGEIYSVLLVNHGDAESEEHHIEATLDHVKAD